MHLIKHMKGTIRWPFEHVSDKEYSIIKVAYIAL